jgi:ribosomal protein S18 acetylase RimI-like enzyme
MTIKFSYRGMTDEEYKREQIAFNEHGLEFGIPPEQQERFGFVATDNKKFVGCSSGLTQKYMNRYCKYFYLSDLLVEKEYRKFGYGKKLLNLLEEKIKSLGIEYIWTWTASYEASTFYQKQGYKIFTTFEDYFPSGYSRVGLIKKL